jgi:hypothetical protein
MMIRIIVILVLAVINAPALHASNWYASPSATTGNGSITNPWSLTLALTNATVVHPGDTVWLRGGTYNAHSVIWPNNLFCDLTGTSNNPIVVRQYPGERAILDGGIHTGNGDWVTFWGFEVTCSTARTNSYANRPSAFSLEKTTYKLINLVLHDTGHPGIGGTAGEIYGCILWGTGIYNTDSPYSVTNPWDRGSAMYLQNSTTNGYNISDNISSRNFISGIKSYAEHGFANGMTVDGNIVFKNGEESIFCEVLYNSITNYTAINNFVYRGGNNAYGYYSVDTLAQHHGLVYSNNYVVAGPTLGANGMGIWLKRWIDMKVVNNTIATISLSNDWSAGTGISPDFGGKFVDYYPSTNAVLSITINSNAYYGGVIQSGGWWDFSGTNYGMFYHIYQPFIYKYEGDVSPVDGTNGLLSFAAWTNSWEYDVNSTYTTNLPTANVVKVLPNKYEVGRGHIVVFNWQTNSTASVDISSLGLTNGQRFEVRDAQNYLGTPCITTNYNVSQPTLTLPLTLTNMTVLTPIGDINYAEWPNNNPDVHTSPLFNAFVVLPKSTSLGTALLPPTGLAVVR